MRILFSLLLLLVFTFSTSAQSSKALKYYQQAREEMASNDFEQALKKALKAVDESPEYAEARMLAAQLYLQQGSQKEALDMYEKALPYNPPYFFYYVYANALFDAEEYGKTVAMLRIYQEQPQVSSKYMELSNTLMDNAAFAQKAVAQPKPYTPVNLGKEVNTDQLDYFPSISADGKTLVFTHRSKEGNKQDEDFWVSTRPTDTSAWGKSELMQGFLNTDFNEGAQSLRSDGGLLFFAACERPEGKGSCDIYASFYQGNGRWSKPVNLGDSINTRAWESQPSISSDGRTLYFVRGASSISKDVDIYTSTLRPDGYWSKAQPLPGKVNTSAQETSPFIHFDDQTLYFSSNGHPGMGDQDFFVSKRLEDGSWDTPKNLGYPINTGGIEFGLIVGPDGKTAYYASDRGEVNYGETDLYSFLLPEEARAEAIAYVKGRVTNIKTQEPLEAEILFSSLGDGARTYADKSGKAGLYFSVLPANTDYALSIQKEGFLFYSKNFSLTTNEKERAFTLDVELIPIEVGKKVKLENVFFATDSYVLDPRSIAELNNVVEFLKTNTTVQISVEGHTDNEGSAAYNKTLSGNRAEAVKQYLIEHGIEGKRLTSKGFGDTQPVADNTTAEGRQLNRRTEIRISGL
jgi:outer membrane protein OmpA-like peptidoglycan-associated protein